MAVIVERYNNALATGNRTSSITVTGTAVAGGAGLNKLVDGGFITTTGVIFDNGVSGAYITFDFGVGVTKSIKGLVWYKATTSAGSSTWKLQGSNDNSTWVDLTNTVTLNSGAGYSPSNSYFYDNGSNYGFYRYFRLLETTGTTINTYYNYEVEFLIVDGSTADNQSAIAPSYSNFLGAGNRTPYINLQNSTTTFIFANVGTLVDGDKVSNQTPTFSGLTGTYIQFDFQSDCLITEITLYLAVAASLGTWKWQGYDRTAAAWVDLGTSFVMGATSPQVINNMSAITDYYASYRLQQVSGSTNTTARFGEFEFKIGYPAIPAVPPVVPTITGISPTSGGTGGGTAVTLTGIALTGTTDVKFGGVSATSIVVVNPTTRTCVTPAGTAGAVNVDLYNPGGNYTLVNGFTYIAATLTVVSPTSGSIAGGTNVTLTGTLFTGATDVKFDTTSATSIVVVNSTTITCVTPAHAAGTVNVTVFTPNGNPTKASSFTYSADPIARVTQTPMLILDRSPQASRVTQTPMLILYQEKQPNRLTQVPELVLYTPKPVPLPLPVVPEIPLLESWGWLTVISTSQMGQEQRGRLRDVPRYKLQMNVLITSDADRVTIYNMLMRYLKTPFLYPLFQYNAQLQQAAAIGDTKIYVNTVFTDIRAGETVALFDPSVDVVTYVDVSTVDSDGINLAAPLAFAVPAYWQVCPALEFRIVPVVGLTMRNVSGSLSLTMESTLPRVFQRPGAAPTLTTIDGLLIVPERPLANDDVPDNFDFGTTWFDNGTSVPDNINEWTNPKVSSKFTYSFNRKARIDYWRAIVDWLKGRQNVALFPSFRNDLPVRDSVALNAISFTTTNINFYNWWLDLTYKYIAINTQNGMKYRAVISVDPHYDANGNPDYLTIKLASSIGNTSGDNVISSISYMNLFRLDDDNITLTHDELDTEIELTIKAVDK
jgi:IPT/TIG domain